MYNADYGETAISDLMHSLKLTLSTTTQFYS